MKKIYLPLCFLLILSFLVSLSTYPETASSPKEQLQLSTQKILAFIRLNKSHFRVEDLILLDFLQRRFQLPAEFTFKNSFTRFPDDRDKKALETYGKLVQYKDTAWKKPRQAESFIWLELKALFIDKPEDCPDKKSLIEQLRSQSREGGYATTHSALALGWFIEQQCLSRDDGETQQLINDIAHQLYSIALPFTFPTDLKVESLAFMCYLGKKNRIDPTLIYSLVYFQRDDGAFSGTISPADGINVHTTLLILWLYLEFLNENTTYTEPMIPKGK